MFSALIFATVHGRNSPREKSVFGWRARRSPGNSRVYLPTKPARKTKKQRLALATRMKGQSLAAKFPQDDAREKSRGEHTRYALADRRGTWGPKVPQVGRQVGVGREAGPSPLLVLTGPTAPRRATVYGEPGGIQAFSSTSLSLEKGGGASMLDTRRSSRGPGPRQSSLLYRW